MDIMNNEILINEVLNDVLNDIIEKIINEIDINEIDYSDNDILKIIYICHNEEIVNKILNDPMKKKSSIIFVSNNELSINYKKNKRIIIAKDLLVNIENEKELLTFTAWYAIIKNNLFENYRYVCLLEYDVILEGNFEDILLEKCKNEENDIISFIPIKYGFNWDIKENIFKYYLHLKNVNELWPEKWYATTNQCMKRNVLASFVDWYYPSCNIIQKLDPKKVSWYHERLFSVYAINYNLKIVEMSGLSHQFSDSHQVFNNNSYDLSHHLIDLYITDSTCELLNYFINNYNLFIELLKDNFELGIGSYLTDGKNNVYDYTKYDKQKLIFNTAKNAKEVLLIGDYRGHLSYVMLLANPDLKITCIENTNYKIPDYLLNNKNFKLICENKEEYKLCILNTLSNNFDLIHISQIYPKRDYILHYLDWIVDYNKKLLVNVIIDDIDVYNSINYKEKFLNNNINCKIIKETKSIGNYSNILLELKIYKQYLLIYNDESGSYDNDINKLVESVIKFSNFEIIIYNNKDINSYFKKSYNSILNQKRGGGYWLWKPYIINETMDNMEDGDLLFYLDNKYFFTDKIKYLLSNKLEQDICIWKNKPNEQSYCFKEWCKMDVIQKYNLNHVAFVENYEICWAGAIVFRKNKKNINIMRRWLELCCNENNITDSPSIIPNNKFFKEHRHDQSLLSIVLNENNIKTFHFERKYLQNSRCPY